MDLSVISIGNSKGIRLSKTLLEKYNIRDKVEVILKEGYLIIRPKKQPREGWDEALKSMHANGDDELLLPAVFEDDKIEEW
jgi:antitoxin MazE